MDEKEEKNITTTETMKVKKVVRGRCFTIVQSVSHPKTGNLLYDENKILAGLSHKTFKRWSWVLHDKDIYTSHDVKNNPNNPDIVEGEPKPPHYHIVVDCGKSPVAIDKVAEWFDVPVNFVTIIKGVGGFLDCVEYQTHETEKQQALGKYLYPDDEINANFDFRSEIDAKHYNRNRYGANLDEKDKQRFDVRYHGKTLLQCVEQNKLLYMKDEDTLKKMRLNYIQDQKPPTTRTNYYICGGGRMGKDLMATALACSLYRDIPNEDEIYFIVGGGNVTFEGYDGQPVIIWSDKRAIELITMLGDRGNVFTVFDVHPKRQRQNVKYGSVNLCNTVNIVTSVEPYNEFLDGLSGEYVDRHGHRHTSEMSQKQQAYGRFPLIIPVYGDYFDILINKGVLGDSDSYTAYQEYKYFRADLRRLAETCSHKQELYRELRMKAVDPVLEQHEVLRLATEKQMELTDDEIRQEFSELGTVNTDLVNEYDRKKQIEELEKRLFGLKGVLSTLRCETSGIMYDPDPVSRQKYEDQQNAEIEKNMPEITAIQGEITELEMLLETLILQDV